jgi:hypothetical protein
MTRGAARRSFLKKRTKKLLLPRRHHLACAASPCAEPNEQKVFWFFFSKKNAFVLIWPGRKSDYSSVLPAHDRPPPAPTASIRDVDDAATHGVPPWKTATDDRS